MPVFSSISNEETGSGILLEFGFEHAGDAAGLCAGRGEEKSCLRHQFDGFGFHAVMPAAMARNISIVSACILSPSAPSSAKARSAEVLTMTIARRAVYVDVLPVDADGEKLVVGTGRHPPLVAIAERVLRVRRLRATLA